MKKGWQEIITGADIKVPSIFKFIIKYITPIFLGWVFFASFPGIYDTLSHKGSNEKIAFYSDVNKISDKIEEQQKTLETKKDFLPEYLTEEYSDEKIEKNKQLNVSTYLLVKKQRALLELVDNPSARKAKIADENKTKLYKNISRIFLLALWLGIAYMVYVASVKRKKEGRLA
jgi:hypothetical protein